MKPSSQDHRFILTLVCNITHYVILVPLMNKDAASVAEAILQKCVFVYGPFKTLITDHGREFKNQLSHQLYLLGTQN